MIYEDYKIGVMLFTVSLLAYIILSKPYAEDNLSAQRWIKKAICGGYTIAFFFLANGIGELGDEWWITALMIMFGMLSFGACIEFFKTYPFAPKVTQEE